MFCTCRIVFSSSWDTVFNCGDGQKKWKVGRNKEHRFDYGDTWPNPIGDYRDHFEIHRRGRGISGGMFLDIVHTACTSRNTGNVLKLVGARECRTRILSLYDAEYSIATALQVQRFGFRRCSTRTSRVSSKMPAVCGGAAAGRGRNCHAKV